MSTNNRYIFNNDYMIGNDEKRLYITYRHHPKVFTQNKSGADPGFFAFLHPEIAKILALFDGMNDLPLIVKEVANRFQISNEYTEKLISSMIENKKRILVTHKGEKCALPSNVIIPLKENNSPSVFFRDIFDIKNYDNSTLRLYKFPLDVTFMVNTICAVDCIYCYADCRNKFDCQIPQHRIKKLIEECRQYGVRVFDLMGGEVLLYKNWKWLIETLRLNGFPIHLSTKVPVSQNIIKEIYDSGIRLFQISLDSFEPNIIEKNLNITDGINYIKKMQIALKEAENHGIKINIHSVITTHNKDVSHLRDFIEKLSLYNNIEKLQISVVGPSLYKHGFQHHRLNSEDIEKLRLFILENKEKFPFNINIPFAISKSFYIDDVESKNARFNNRALCTGNVRQVFILPNGDVTICEELMFHPKFILGNIINEDLHTIWKKNRLSYLEDINTYQNSFCGKCNSFDSCKGNTSKGVCWKEILHAYGEEKWNYPDPKCPHAPIEMNDFFIE